MGRFGKPVDACEYGATGAMGWAQDHAVACAMAGLLVWLAVLYAVFSSMTTLAG